MEKVIGYMPNREMMEGLYCEFKKTELFEKGLMSFEDFLYFLKGIPLCDYARKEYADLL